MFRILRPAIAAVSAIILVSAGVSCQSDHKQARDVIDAIPMHSAILFRINNLDLLESALNKSVLYAELDTLPAIRSLTADLQSVHLLIPSAEGQRRQNIWAVATMAGADRYDLLFLRPAQPIDSLPADLDWQTRKYGETDIYSAKTTSGEWFLASHRGVDMLSRNSRLVEESLRQIESGISLGESADFQKALGTVNPKDVFNMLVNFGEVHGFSEYIFPNSDPLFMDGLGTWSAYDASIKADAVMLNGIHLTPDSANSWLSSFHGNASGSFKAQVLLPTNMAQAVMINVGNFAQYNRNYTRYLKRSNRNRAFEQQISELSFDLNEVLLSWGGEEFGLISLETDPNTVAQPRVAYISARNTEEALNKLSVQADPDFVDNHRNYIIHKCGTSGLLPLGYGRIFRDMVAPYYAAHGKYIIFGNNLLTLKGVLNDLIDGRTLGDQAAFRDVINTLTDKGHVRVIHKNPGALGLINRLLEPTTAREIRQSEEQLSRIAWSVVQFTTDRNVSYAQLYVKHQEEHIPEAKQLWALPLSGEVVGQPQFVVNHYTRQNEVVVQDKNNVLYLIDSGGNILWKRKLDGHVRGRITQVDLFRNNKLQLALNTETTLYIIDRNGVDVSPFPIALPQKATAAMAVFDYDRTRNYRFVVPCGDRVYNFDKDGKQVQGWVFPRTETPVLRRPQHFSVAGRDFIVIREQSGQIHLVSRRGETRIESRDPLPDTHNELYLSVGKTQEETRIVTLSEGGQLVSLFMNGTVDSTDISLASNPAEFMYRDGRYIITQNGHFTVKDDLHPFKIDLDADLSAPLYFVHNNTPMYGVVIPESDQVWLLDQSGEALPGLPLYGSSLFCVGEFGRRGVLNLVVGTADGNLLNYKLE